MARALGELGHQLTALARGEAGAREALLARAVLPGTAGRQLDAFTKAAGQLGALKEVRFTGIEVQATLWFGVTAVRRADVALRLAPGPEPGARVLHLATRPSDLGPFDRRGAGASAPGPAGAVAKLGDVVVSAIAEQRCDEVPVVTAEDLPGTTEQVRQQLQRLQARVLASCRLAHRYRWHRATWDPAVASGVIETTDGRRTSFRLELSPGPGGELKLARLTRPVARSRKAP